MKRGEFATPSSVIRWEIWVALGLSLRCKLRLRLVLKLPNVGIAARQLTTHNKTIHLKSIVAEFTERTRVIHAMKINSEVRVTHAMKINSEARVQDNDPKRFIVKITQLQLNSLQSRQLFPLWASYRLGHVSFVVGYFTDFLFIIFLLLFDTFRCIFQLSRVGIFQFF